MGVGQRGLWKMSLCGSIVFPWPFRRLPWSLVNARGLALASLLLSRGQGCRVAQSRGNSALCVYQPLLASRPSEQHRVLYHRAGGCAARRGGPGALGWGPGGAPLGQSRTRGSRLQTDSSLRSLSQESGACSCVRLSFQGIFSKMPASVSDVENLTSLQLPVTCCLPSAGQNHPLHWGDCHPTVT